MNSRNKKRKPFKALSGALLIMTVLVSMTALIGFAGCATQEKVKHPLIEDMQETLVGDKLVKKNGKEIPLKSGYCVSDQWLTDTAGLEVE